MRKIHLVWFMLFIVMVGNAYALEVGDYRFSGSGNWTTTARWSVCSSVSPLVWSASATYPNDQHKSIYMESGARATLDIDGINVKDIHFRVDSNSVYGALNLARRTISIHGIISRFSGNAPGTVLPNTDTLQPNIVLASTETVIEPFGTLRFTGSGRSLSNSWNFLGFDGMEANYPKLVIDMNTNDDVAIWEQRNRFKKVHIVRGILHSTWTLRISNGPQGGDFIINEGAAFESRILPGTQYNVEVFCSVANTPIGIFDLGGTLRLFAPTSVLLLNAAGIAATSSIEYAGGNQTLATGGAFQFHYNLVLSGSGIKQLSQNISVFNTLIRKGSATLERGLYSLTYDPDYSTLVYELDEPGSTTSQEWPNAGPRNVIINCDLSLHAGRTIAGDLTLLSGNFDLGSRNLNVQGTVTEITGSYSGGNGYFDGYDARKTKYLQVLANNTHVHVPRFEMSTDPLYPQLIDRQWTTHGIFTGGKEISFMWHALDDGNYNWTLSDPPRLYFNGIELAGTQWELLPGNLRRINVTVSGGFVQRGVWTIGRELDQTLPMHLASFSASLIQGNTVSINWSTHTETSMLGYYIYRNQINDHATSIAISALIPAHNSSQTSQYSHQDQDVDAGNTWYYWLYAVQFDGYADVYGPVSAFIPEHIEAPIPVMSPALTSIYPNPAKASLTLCYDRKDMEMTRIMIFNIKGQCVRNIDVSGAAGSYVSTWDTRDAKGSVVPAGIYFIRFQAGEFSQTRKAILIK